MSQRTQIYLPEDLRQQIDEELCRTGESLAEYLRKIAREDLYKRKKKKVDLKKLADELGRSVKKSGWEGIDVLKWQREIRKDRKLS